MDGTDSQTPQLQNAVILELLSPGKAGGFTIAAPSKGPDRNQKRTRKP